jgi:hypothetical protein
MKIIFLDIDGVLNSGDNLRALHYLKIQHNYGEANDEFGQLFDERCVRNLTGIIQATGAKIVMSSTWKMYGLENMQAMWEKRNLPGKLIGITPNGTCAEFAERHYHPGVDRGYEIQQWIEDHPEIEGYVILDDDSDMLPYQKFVKCNFNYGLTYSDAQYAIEILNNQVDETHI